MVTAKQVYDKGIERLKDFNIRGYLPALRGVSEGGMEDIFNINGCAYYQWLPGIIKEFKPKQIVELGGAMGGSALMMLQELPPESKLYSITLPEQGQEFSWVVDEYPNLIKVLGDDLDLNNWPNGLDLNETDLWFFDTLHTEDHLRKEIDLYSPFFKKGAIVLFDDIHLHDGMNRVWSDIRKSYDSYDGTDPLHYSGYGIVVI